MPGDYMAQEILRDFAKENAEIIAVYREKKQTIRPYYTKYLLLTGNNPITRSLEMRITELSALLSQVIFTDAEVLEIPLLPSQLEARRALTQEDCIYPT